MRRLLAALLPVALAAACTDGTSPQAAFEVLPRGTLSMGASYGCGITLAGGAVCWGDAHSGQLGNGIVMHGAQFAPGPVHSAPALAQVSAGTTHACGLTAEGVAYCWGRNNWGQLGRGTISAHEPVAAPVQTALRFILIDTGTEGTCALDLSGAAHCWGGLEVTNLLIRDTPIPHDSVPTPVPGGLRFTELAMGEGHACALTADGAAFCWGNNNHGALGGGEPIETTEKGGSAHYRTAPTAVAGGFRFRRLAAGYSFTCAITLDDSAVCWGWNGMGTLGDGSQISRTTPAPALTPTRFVELDATLSHACALTREGAAFCWGVLSDTPPLFRLVPIPIPGGMTFRRIASGEPRSCGVTREGDVFCWGRRDGPALVPGLLAGGVKLR